MDKREPFGAGMPSHIRSDDCDAFPLIESFLESESETQHVRRIFRLAMILDENTDAFCTLKATKRTSKDFTLSLKTAHPLPLLRPLEYLTLDEEEDHGIVGPRLAVRAGAKQCAEEVVDFVENISPGALDEFGFHVRYRANFAIASSFLMQLLVTSESEMERNNNIIFTRPILMSLGLLRPDGLLLEDGTLQLATGWAL
ncbi:hypothetical protein BJ878DRAFT_537436 [Calycina marina]|uniref:Uncharacterized protein n=1 Tax=Calycina marina TaxID=1763456 RepID=A0A9P7YUD5_9HELO|nr:hypothetical protein BJ878DRAFT_537436 [Calycina marina]